MTARLAGKIAIVTGGGGGIGAATGKLFCRHDAKLILVDRDAHALKAAEARIRGHVAAAQVAAFECDVSDPAAATDAVAFAIRTFGGLDVLVNNAAVRDVNPIESADAGRWSDVMRVNLIGAINFCKASVGELRKAGRASVVNVSSCYAVRGRSGFGAYDASKAALLSLTRTFAWEEAKHGIRANAVCPGGTLTPFTVGRGRARGLDEAGMRKEPKQDALLGRWAEPEEIAYPILWLASDEASFVTGAALMVDGGSSVM